MRSAGSRISIEAQTVPTTGIVALCVYHGKRSTRRFGFCLITVTAAPIITGTRANKLPSAYEGRSRCISLLLKKLEEDLSQELGLLKMGGQTIESGQLAM